MESICSYEQAIQTVLNSELIQNPRGNPGKRNPPQYINLVTAFDIETSTIDVGGKPQAFMYVWQMQFGDSCLVMGRTWEDFNKLTKLLTQAIKHGFGSRAMLVVYVHNLSFEFSFLKGVYPFSEREVFCMDRRKVLKCTMHNALEFRCSYIQSNMSLALFCQKMGCDIQKLTGTYNYKKVRYPWTKLTPKEIAYCVHDVQGLVEAITREMASDGDNLSTIPLTSTGYVRRDAKEAMQKMPNLRLYIKDQVPDFMLYKALRMAFRGGKTHANRYYAGQILNNVHSVDRSSSYPDVLVNCEFPVSHFEFRGEITVERLEKNINLHHKAALIRIEFSDVELSNKWEGCPYLTKDKCDNIVNGIFDNGRILSADFLTTVITDIDYRIIKAQYSGEMVITHSWFARYGYLPDEFRNLIKEYYRQKTELKGIKEKQVFYDKFKNRINALYGLSAQAPVKDNVIFASADKVKAFYDAHPKYIRPADEGPNFIPDESQSPEQLLIKYNKKTFLPYQWGVWVTAHARRELQEMIDLAGDNFVYTDTDSVKFIGDMDLTEYNTRIAARSIYNGMFAFDSKGNVHYGGVFERESDYNRFCTLGAKKYAYTIHGRIGVTCAGVDKRYGAEELRRAGGLKAFRPGMKFRKAGGTETIYNDNIDITIIVDGRELRITDNVVIKDSEYTLGVTNEYKMLLRQAMLLNQLMREKDIDNYLKLV